MSTLPGCEAAVKKQNPNFIVCNVQHCTPFSETDTFHGQCADAGKDPLHPVPTAQCIDLSTGVISEPTYNEKYNVYICPAPLAVLPCYCCCSCFARGTPVASPDGMKAIEMFNTGDMIFVATMSASLNPTWGTKAVAFSSGSDAGSKGTVLYIRFGDNSGDDDASVKEPGHLIVTKDQLLLLADGKLKKADRLVPHQDQLVSAKDGKPININSISIGEWRGGLHHIATSMDYTGSTGEHLLNSNGVITGDYCLQVHSNELIKQGLMHNPESSHVIGSTEYQNAYPYLDVTPVSVVNRDMASASNISNNTMREFTALSATPSNVIPDNAATLFTDAQAQDIKDSAKFSAMSDDSGFSMVEYLIKIFKGFYSDINIVIDKGNPNVNTYAFEILQQKHLVISGALIRLTDLHQDGYKFIIAQGIARLLGKVPQDSNGLTYVGAADFYATSDILRNVFYLDFSNICVNIQKETNALFGYIKNKQGNPEDKANNPDVDCRLAAIQVGIIGGSVPECSGGPSPDLQLLSIKPNASGSIGQFLNLIFSADIDSNSIGDLSNYMLRDAAHPDTIRDDLPKVLSADLDATNTKVVALRVQAKQDIEYTLIVRQITATNGSTLDLQHNSQKFKFISSSK